MKLNKRIVKIDFSVFFLSLKTPRFLTILTKILRIRVNYHGIAREKQSHFQKYSIRIPLLETPPHKFLLRHKLI
jgi:hypothetical protein